MKGHIYQTPNALTAFNHHRRELGLYCVMFPLASHFSIVAVGWAWAALSFRMVPIALTMLHRVAGLDVGALLAKDARIALCGGPLIAAVVLVRAVLPSGPWSLPGRASMRSR